MIQFDVRVTGEDNVLFEINNLAVIVPRGLKLEGTIDCVPGTNSDTTNENTLTVSGEVGSHYMRITVKEFGNSETVRMSPQLFGKVLEIYEHG